MTYKHKGGLHFFSIGRLGIVWYWRTKRNG